MITNMYNHQNHHHRDAVVSTREPTDSSHRDRSPKADSGHPSLINRRAKSRDISTYSNEYIMINPFTSSWSPLNVKNKLTVHTAIKHQDSPFMAIPVSSIYLPRPSFLGLVPRMAQGSEIKSNQEDHGRPIPMSPESPERRYHGTFQIPETSTFLWYLLIWLDYIL